MLSLVRNLASSPAGADRSRLRAARAAHADAVTALEEARGVVGRLRDTEYELDATERRARDAERAAQAAAEAFARSGRPDARAAYQRLADRAEEARQEVARQAPISEAAVDELPNAQRDLEMARQRVSAADRAIHTAITEIIRTDADPLMREYQSLTAKARALHLELTGLWRLLHDGHGDWGDTAAAESVRMVLAGSGMEALGNICDRHNRMEPGGAEQLRAIAQWRTRAEQLLADPES